MDYSLFSTGPVLQTIGMVYAIMAAISLGYQFR